MPAGDASASQEKAESTSGGGGGMGIAVHVSAPTESGVRREEVAGASGEGISTSENGSSGSSVLKRGADSGDAVPVRRAVLESVVVQQAARISELEARRERKRARVQQLSSEAMLGAYLTPHPLAAVMPGPVSVGGVHPLAAAAMAPAGPQDSPSAAGSADKKQSRYWTPDEHARFLAGVKTCGPKNYTQIAEIVGTRNPKQVRTHAQKFQKKLEREEAKRKGMQNQFPDLRSGAAAHHHALVDAAAVAAAAMSSAQQQQQQQQAFHPSHVPVPVAFGANSCSTSGRVDPSSGMANGKLPVHFQHHSGNSSYGDGSSSDMEDCEPGVPASTGAPFSTDNHAALAVAAVAAEAASLAQAATLPPMLGAPVVASTPVPVVVGKQEDVSHEINHCAGAGENPVQTQSMTDAELPTAAMANASNGRDLSNENQNASPVDGCASELHNQVAAAAEKPKEQSVQKSAILVEKQASEQYVAETAIEASEDRSKQPVDLSPGRKPAAQDPQQLQEEAAPMEQRIALPSKSQDGSVLEKDAPCSSVARRDIAGGEYPQGQVIIAGMEASEDTPEETVSLTPPVEERKREGGMTGVIEFDEKCGEAAPGSKEGTPCTDENDKKDEKDGRDSCTTRESVTNEEVLKPPPGAKSVAKSGAISANGEELCPERKKNGAARVVGVD